jgi:hypothetical protein
MRAKVRSTRPIRGFGRAVCSDHAFPQAVANHSPEKWFGTRQKIVGWLLKRWIFLVLVCALVWSNAGSAIAAGGQDIGHWGHGSFKVRIVRLRDYARLYWQYNVYFLG